MAHEVGEWVDRASLEAVTGPIFCTKWNVSVTPF
jgi:hypothetical protein